MYYIKTDENEKREITRSEAHQAPFDGIQDVETYLDEIESGKYGRNNVQVTENVYFDTDED